MRYLRTPSGKAAPLFSAVWNMTTGKDKNKAGNQYYSCNKDGKSSIVFKEWVSKETYLEYVAPARQVADQAVMLADNRTQAIEADAGAAETEGDF